MTIRIAVLLLAAVLPLGPAGVPTLRGSPAEPAGPAADVPELAPLGQYAGD